jgi:hypothetical protein
VSNRARSALRQTLRLAAVAWFVLALFVAYGRLAAWPVHRDIGAGVLADCTHSPLSEVAQVVLAFVGFGVLAQIANGPLPTSRRRRALPAAILACWLVALFAVPALFARTCVN